MIRRFVAWLMGPPTFAEWCSDVERVAPGAAVEQVDRHGIPGELVIYTGHVVDEDGHVVPAESDEP